MVIDMQKREVITKATSAHFDTAASSSLVKKKSQKCLLSQEGQVSELNYLPFGPATSGCYCCCWRSRCRHRKKDPTAVVMRLLGYFVIFACWFAWLLSVASWFVFPFPFPSYSVLSFFRIYPSGNWPRAGASSKFGIRGSQAVWRLYEQKRKPISSRGQHGWHLA